MQTSALSHLGSKGEIPCPSTTLGPFSYTLEEKKEDDSSLFYAFLCKLSELPFSSWKHLEIVHVCFGFDSFFAFFCSLKPA